MMKMMKSDGNGSSPYQDNGTPVLNAVVEANREELRRRDASRQVIELFFCGVS